MIKINEIKSTLKESGKVVVAVNKFFICAVALNVLKAVDKVRGNK